MELNMDAKLKSDASPATESVGDATMISYSVFASLEEMRQAQTALEHDAAPNAAAEGAAAAAPTAAAEAAEAENEPAGDSLQAELDRYTDWLRTFNR